MPVIAHLIPYYREIEGEVVAGAMSLAFRWHALTPADWYLKANTLKSSPVVHTRNLLAEWALDDQGPIEASGRADERGPPADVLLWQDSDCPLGVEDLVALVGMLLAAPPDVGAIAAPCVTNTPSGETPTTNVNFNDHPEGLAPFLAGATVECSVAGFGVIATRASVYRALGFPWFQWRYAGPTTSSCIGEDMGWCQDARRAGFAIFAAGALDAGHIFPREYHRTSRDAAWLAASRPRKG